MEFFDVEENEIVEIKNTRQSKKGNISKDISDLLKHIAYKGEGDRVAMARDTKLFPVKFDPVEGKPGTVWYGEPAEETLESTARTKSYGKYMAAVKAIILKANDERASRRIQRYPGAVDSLNLVLQERGDGSTKFGKDGISRYCILRRGFIGGTTEEKARLAAAMEAQPDTDPYAIYKQITGKTAKEYPFDELLPAEEETPLTPKPKARR